MPSDSTQSANSTSSFRLIAGRLALDFVNTASNAHALSWEDFVAFLASTQVVSLDRAARLRALILQEPLAIRAVLAKILQLREAQLAIFSALARKKTFSASWTKPINEILRITEGHDELMQQGDRWRLQFIDRKRSL